MFRIRPDHARFGMAVAALVGLFSAGYLFYTYVTGAPITCALVSGCDVVRLSKWANSLGLPRPFWGLVFYTGVFGLLVARVATTWKPRFLYRLTMLAAIIGFIESGFLFLIQWLDLKAFCLWCLISGLAATIIVILAPFDRIEETHHLSPAHELKRYFILLLAFLPIAFFFFVWLLSQGHVAPETLLRSP